MAWTFPSELAQEHLEDLESVLTAMGPWEDFKQKNRMTGFGNWLVWRMREWVVREDLQVLV